MLGNFLQRSTDNQATCK